MVINSYTEGNPATLNYVFDSTNVHSAKYDPITESLTIIFSSGRRYHYNNIDTDLLTNFIGSKSTGKAFHSLFKNKKHTRLSDIKLI